MTLPITVPQAVLWEKLSVYDHIVIKNLKGKINEYQKIFTLIFI